MMEESSAINSEKPHLITEAYVSPYSETTFSVLPVIVEGQTTTLEEIEHNPLEETILSVPWITLDHGNQVTLLPNSQENQEDSSIKDDVVEVEENPVEAETEAAVDWEDVGIEIEEVPGYPAVFEAHVLQLDGGTLAYIHSHPQDGCQTVQLEDGKVAYITLTQPIVQESTELKVEEDNSPKKTKSFLCPQVGCGRLYTSSNHLKVHERTHTGSRPYNCTVEGCNKAFSTDYSRKAHIRTHTGEKPYECPEGFCSKRFKTSGDLQKHVRTHTGERPFACPVEGCNRSFTTSNIRKVHIRTHTGERPYVCNHPYCTKAFASATNYKNHIRIHSGEKPYVCNVAGCNKRFTEYSSLYKHHMVHTQEKPYQCNVCGRSYRQASTLTVHKRTSHGMIEADDGTELMLGNVLTQKVVNSGNITTEANKTKTKTIGTNALTNGDFILDSEGCIKKISNEQIFIIEDIPEHLNVLQV